MKIYRSRSGGVNEMLSARDNFGQLYRAGLILLVQADDGKQYFSTIIFIDPGFEGRVNHRSQVV